LDDFDHFGGEFDAPLTNVETFVIHLAFAGDDVKKTAGDAGRPNGAIAFDPFFKAALPAAFA
jgi:hypothetical protein